MSEPHPLPVERVLAISSQVMHGHVGLSAIWPALTVLGIEVIPVPTVLLSSHAGHASAVRSVIAADRLADMIAALEDEGWLDVDGVLTGYLPTERHVDVAADAIDRARAVARKAPVIVCDPVIGDDPKGLYIDAAAAEAVRTRLLPRADVITPNRFELEWLSGRKIGSVVDAVAAARSLPARATVATSIEDPEFGMGNVVVSALAAQRVPFAKKTGTWRGTGDTFAAILLAHLLDDRDGIARAAALATGALDHLITAGAGSDELPIVSAAGVWRRAPAVRTEARSS